MLKWPTVVYKAKTHVKMTTVLYKAKTHVKMSVDPI